MNDNIEERNHIEAMYLLHELYGKQVRTEEEIQAEIDRINLIDDLEERERQLKELNDNFITEEQYNAEIEAIQEMFPRTDEEMKAKADRCREKLRVLKRYYTERAEQLGGRNVMANYDIDALDDFTAIEDYFQISNGLDVETFEEIISRQKEIEAQRENALEEQEREAARERVRQRMEEARGFAADRASLLNKGEKFDIDISLLNKEINKVYKTLILTDGISSELSAAIKDIETDFEELRAEAQVIMNEINALKDNYGSEEFSAGDVKRAMDEIKDKIKEIKNLQIEKYNARVSLLNNEVAKLREHFAEDEEVLAMIDGVNVPSMFDKKVMNFNSNGITSDMYDNLFVASAKIKDIQSRDPSLTTPGNEVPLDKQIESEIEHLNKELLSIEEKLNVDEITSEMRSSLEEELNAIRTSIDALSLRVNNSAKELSEDVFGDFIDDLIKLGDEENRLRELLTSKKVIDSSAHNTEFGKMKDEIIAFDAEVKTSLHLLTSTINGSTALSIALFERTITTFEARLADFRTEVQELYDNKLIDENQYNNLKERLDVVEENINKMKDTMTNAVALDDIYAMLNGKIAGVEKALEALEAKVNSSDKPIKKETRKEIDKLISKIEKDIKAIERQLSEISEEERNEEEENRLRDRLNKANEKLSNLKKDYRKKCPLLVKAVKSTKEFYKNHKKAVLVAAGLSAIALLHATVGPVVIPALMHGNQMIGTAAPALSGFTTGLNNILGGMINATNSNGIWTLANGVQITPAVATTSLLKGLAVSGVSSVALASPIILAVKELASKIKLKGLREKVSNAYTAGKEKSQEAYQKLKEKATNATAKGKKKVKEKTDEVKEKAKGLKKKAASKIKKEEKKKERQEFKDALNIVKLYLEFMKSGKEFEDFCKDKDMSESMKNDLCNYVSMKLREVMVLYDEYVASEKEFEDFCTEKGLSEEIVQKLKDYKAKKEVKTEETSHGR